MGPQDSYEYQFDDALLNDMTNSCQTLEKRVRQGPNSLSETDVLELESALKRIIQEMNSVTDNNKKSDATATPLNQNQDKSMLYPKTEQEVLTRSPPPKQQPSSSSETRKEAVVLDTSNDDDGIVYEGKGHMGQPRGTVNTYYLPGMEEMNAEEFRSALEKSLIERQAKRRKMGNVGNNAVKDYLENL